MQNFSFAGDISLVLTWCVFGLFNVALQKILNNEKYEKTFQEILKSFFYKVFFIDMLLAYSIDVNNCEAHIYYINDIGAYDISRGMIELEGSTMKYFFIVYF